MKKVLIFASFILCAFCAFLWQSRDAANTQLSSHRDRFESS